MENPNERGECEKIEARPNVKVKIKDMTPEQRKEYEREMKERRRKKRLEQKQQKERKWTG